MTTTVTKTIRASGGDYSLLSTWEAARQRDLTSADEIEVAECYNDWPSGLNDAVTVSGWTTDSSRYVKICAATGHEHGGIPEAGFFLSKSTYGSDVVTVSQQYTRIEKIQVTKTGGTSGTALVTSADNVSISGLLLKSLGGCFYTGIGNNISVESCAALSGTLGFGFGNARSGRTISNCVASNISGNGFLSASATDVIVENCVSYNNTTNWSGTFSASSSHNATSSASDDAPGSDSVWNISSSDFVDAANNDFHLASGSALIGAGVNLYSTFTTDIDGDTWPSSGAWDIGFDYYVASGHTVSVGQVTETDTAQAISRRKVKAFGQVVETNSAQAFTKRKSKVFGQSTETDLAQVITVFVAGGPITVAVDQVVETDTAQAFTHRKLKAFGQVTETDTAQSVSKRKIRQLGQTVETDTAQGIVATGPKIITVGKVTETDSAQAFTRFKRKVFGQTFETDAVFAFSKRKIRVVGQVEETDSATSMTIIGGIPSDGWADEVAIGGTGWATASGASGSWTEAAVETGTWVEESAL